MNTAVVWHGAPPSAALKRLLDGAGVAVSKAGRGDRTVVVSTVSGGRPPAAPHGASSWLWASRTRVSSLVAREAVLRGAYDVVSLADRDGGDRLVRRLGELAVPLPPPPASDVLVTHSAVSKALVAQVARVAATARPVLLVGETGSGKEVMARTIHAWSTRRGRQFLPINCAAIPDELMEAELFGYARGAFSGAVQQYDGQLMAAAGGTVFLDEIDDTPPEMQVKLLRVLEDRVVSRLGQNEWHEVDFRILAATNRDLGALVSDGLFGQDLYERLAIATIRLPPLRERLEDLEALAMQFIARFVREQGRSTPIGLTADARDALKAYPWPGNIRELRNVLYETLVYKRAGDEILLSDLPRRVLQSGRDSDRPVVDRAGMTRRLRAGTMNLRDELEALERVALDEALTITGGNAAAAARLLGTVGRGAARNPGGTVRAMLRRLRRGA